MKRQKKKIKKNSKLKFDNTCPNCGEAGPHFCPPSFGDIGFYTCKPKNNKKLKINNTNWAGAKYMCMKCGALLSLRPDGGCPCCDLT